PVQQIDQGTLRARLIQDGQVIEWATAPKAARPETKPNGIVMDDGDGDYRGEWLESSRMPSFIGGSYRHDDHREQGAKSVRFTPDLPELGLYEVRLIYVPTNNRARNVPVIVHTADGDREVSVNQREPMLDKGVPRALGRFRFEKGRSGFVEVSNAGADGYVVVDGVQFVPAALADEERSGKRASGFAASPGEAGGDLRKAMAAAVAVSPLTPEQPGNVTAPPSDEPVALAKDASPADVTGKRYDLVVVGGTAGGVACAVRAARDGCRVLLVQHNR
ncbi:MAG: FAD-dependent oxidoreductase, partial [Verrucomicrobiae bacterium]|nr:FAD-dependent oxidoreductase [Verrucomicrobiae bacterium]